MYIKVSIDSERVSSSDVIRRVMDRVPVRDISIEEEQIEDIVKQIYSGKMR